MVVQRPIELQELSKYFNMPEKAVAKQLGICLTSLKKICRQNGIMRWPYRKVKSLDKKLRKLEVAMSSAKDDPSMVYAKWGDRDHMDNSSDSGSSCTSGSTPCSEQASIASTPRHPRDDSPLPYECSSPFQESDYTMSTEAVSPIPVRVCKHESDGKAVEPVKIELCFSSESLQHVAHVNGNIMFALQGVDEVLPERGTTPVQQIHSNFPDSLLPPNQAAPMSIFVKAEPIEEDPDTSGMDMGSLSDDDLIALLAHCAGSDHSSGHARSASFASHRRTDLSDAEIMQALAGCCEAPIAYGLDQEEGAMAHPSNSQDSQVFLELDNDFDFQPSFHDFTCGENSSQLIGSGHLMSEEV